MKKFYLKPELEEIIEMPEVTIMNVSPTDEDKPGDDDTPGGGWTAPKWRKF